MYLFLWIVFCILYSIEKLSPREIDHLIQPPGSATCIQPPDSATCNRPSVSASRIQSAERRRCSVCQFLLELRSLDLNQWTLKALQTTCRTQCRPLARTKRWSACEPNCEPTSEPALGTSVGTHAGTPFGPACETARRTQCRTQCAYDCRQKTCRLLICYSF